MTLSNILQKLGIAELNDMQREAFDAILRSRNDVIILSPTGSGKTLAYLLPLVQLLNAGSDDVQALIVVPGRELALQSDRVLKSLGTGLRSQSCYGGRTAMDEHRVLRQNRPQLVFGTPGRLNDHLDKGNIDASHIQFLIIDEFDKCLEMGFHDEMQRLIRKLPSLQRRILLSATDAEQLPQVFTNLIKNALQALEEQDDGDIIVILKDMQNEVEVTVSDNGPGIAEDVKSKVFVPNFTTKSTGTGLGLAISKNIVEGSGGHIRFETSDKGTSFYVTLRK